jgi:GT2 family glycosyltransferase
VSSAVSVSVVVAGSNGRPALGRCLRSLTADPAPVHEVLVADPALGAGDPAWVASLHPRARTLRLAPGIETNTAVRAAFAAATGSHVALLASHAAVEPGWQQPLLAALAADAAVAAACPTLLWHGEDAAVCAAGGRITWLGIGFDEGQGGPYERGAGTAATTEVSFAPAAALLISRADWQASRGFDPVFAAGNADVDLGWRLWLLGRRVVACRDSVVRADGSQPDAGPRPHGWASAALLRQTVRMLLTHYPPRFLLHALRWTARSRAASQAMGPLLAAAAWNLVHLPGTLLRREWLQRRRRTAHEALFAGGVLLELHDPPRPSGRRTRPVQVDTAGLIVSEVLLPGADSALGRLGDGWLPVERLEGDPVRWTRCGAADGTLKVEAGAAGRVRAAVRLPAGSSAANVTLACNGAEVTTAASPGSWLVVEAPARADAGGLLRVTVSAAPSAAGSPGPSPRRPGCAVREIRFVSDRAPSRDLPSSISVIIPTYNRWPILAEALAALARQTMRDFEVVVVDDGSTDGTWEALDAWRRVHPQLALQAIRQPNLKPGRARNRGLREAGGDLVMFLGDDIIPAPDLLEQHLAKHREVGETIGVLGLTEWDRTRMRVTPFLDFVNSDGPQFAYAHFRDGGDIPFTGLYTSNISLPRRVLGDDPFHPAFTFVDWEDIELGYRLSRRGLRLIYHAAARAAHYHPIGVRQFYRRQEHVGRTIGVIFGLHPELAGNPVMPPLEPRPWFGLMRRAAPALVPLLGRIDALGIRLPVSLYRNLLLCAFWSGRAEASLPPPATGT